MAEATDAPRIKFSGRPTLVLDFDGVIHAYTSGFKGHTVISDPPVDGALEFIVDALDHFKVAIFSTRSGRWGGRRAMKQWLLQQLMNISNEPSPKWWVDYVVRHSGMDPWREECWWAAIRVVNEIDWPKTKPPAWLTIDDRAITFTGKWPSVEEIHAFKPWNKQ